MKRKAIEAAKQSRRAWLSDIAAAQDFESVVGRFGEFDAAFMAQSGSGSVSFLTALGALPESSRVLVLIGPEGGWSDPELQRAQAGRAIACTLGPTILRTETAAASVCAIAAGLSRSSTTG